MTKLQTDKADLLFRKVTSNDDEAAFRCLYYDFFSPLCVFAYRFLEEEDACLDVVQEFFFQLWKNRRQIEIHVSVRNFFMTSVRNACLDLLRRQEVERKWIEKSLKKEENELNYDLYTTTELENLLNKALDKLPEKMSSSFRMNRFEGKTYVEIAEEKQISVKTVESYISKTLKFLKIELKDYLSLFLIILPGSLG